MIDPFDSPANNPRLIERVLDQACKIQQIPSPTFGESERARWVFEQFQQENHGKAEIDAAGNVLTRIPGRASGRPLVVSAHLDTVFPRETNLALARSPVAISGPGIGDNSLGVAGLFSLLWGLREPRVQLPGDVWLVANVCEEGLGNLKGISAVVSRFEAQPVAYLVLEGIGLGQVYHRGLPIRRFRVEVQTPGGHSWSDFGRPSAVHELISLLNQITGLPVPREPRSSLNVGVIQGGTSINTLASDASAEIDLRSTSEEVLTRMAGEIVRLAQNTNRKNVRCRIEQIGQRPAGEIDPEHPLVRLAIEILRELNVVPRTGIGSTDANAPLHAGFPSICVGLTTGGGVHTLEEFIRVEPLAKGIEQIFRFVSRAWEIL